MLKEIYGTAYTDSHAQNNVASIAFAGTVVGHLFFGVLSDYWSRKNALLTSTVILIVFAALCAGSYGANDNVQGLFACLVAFRFLLGIGIGGEYPAGSTAAAEVKLSLLCSKLEKTSMLKADSTRQLANSSMVTATAGSSFRPILLSILALSWRHLCL